MIYEFDSEELIKRFEGIPEAEKVVKAVEMVTLKSGEQAQIQIVLTTNKNEFVKSKGKHFSGYDN